ncbi:MAG: inverse autotransporter beta domain-containing protein [Oceanisphaera sp.]|uniref:inverse autotransporter beta domain-containing protein n=1 Tax=Oceanisphaera sp. TaxID=1929979 RepID=UPI003C74107B
MTQWLNRFILLLALSISGLSQAADTRAAIPQVAMHQVMLGESWRLLAARYQLNERVLRRDFNPQRFMTPLTQGDWIWVPDRSAPSVPTRAVQIKANKATLPSSLPSSLSAPRHTVRPSDLPSTPQPESITTRLPQLGRPNPELAPQTDRVLLTLATAAKAAAMNNIDTFVEQQGERLADNTLSFGSHQLSEWLWFNPELWNWDYQLPLFDKDPLLSSQMALPIMANWQGELGVDYRDERLTYQAGLHFEQPLTATVSGHVEPVMDYQADWDHQRGGLLLFLEHRDWTLGAGQYQPLSGWRQQAGRQERPAAGQLLFGEGRLGMVPGLSVSGKYYQWQGRQLNLYGSGDKYKAPQSRQWSLNYSPWEILTLKSSLLSNSKDKFESRVSLGIELPLGIEPGLWWQSLIEKTRYDSYLPLQHNNVMVLEHQ